MRVVQQASDLTVQVALVPALVQVIGLTHCAAVHSLQQAPPSAVFASGFLRHVLRESHQSSVAAQVMQVPSGTHVLVVAHQSWPETAGGVRMAVVQGEMLEGRAACRFIVIRPAPPAGHPKHVAHGSQASAPAGQRVQVLPTQLPLAHCEPQQQTAPFASLEAVAGLSTTQPPAPLFASAHHLWPAPAHLHVPLAVSHASPAAHWKPHEQAALSPVPATVVHAPAPPLAAGHQSWPARHLQVEVPWSHTMPPLH